MKDLSGGDVGRELRPVAVISARTELLRCLLYSGSDEGTWIVGLHVGPPVQGRGRGQPLRGS